MAPAVVVCTRCGGENSPKLRYCGTCGTSLSKKSASSTRPSAPAPETVSPAAAPPATANRTAVSAQKRPAAAQPEAPRERTCWRCNAVVLPRAAFCQECGADLRSGASGRGPVAPAARLIVIAQDGTPGREYPIEAGRLEIGRTQGDIQLPEDPYVCPAHARITFQDSRFELEDLSSVNGIFIRLTQSSPLTDGDLLLAGLQVLRFEVVAPEHQNFGQAAERGTRVFGSPAVHRQARLVQLTVEGMERDIVYLHRGQTTIGRETGDIVFTDDPFMSRQHAMLTQTAPGEFSVSDLNSSNGTFLAIRGNHGLTDGDQMRIGQHLFQLRVDG